jgi:hypothetical protein
MPTAGLERNTRKIKHYDDRYAPAKCSSGSRAKSAIKCVVVHQTEGPSAESAAHYFTYRPDGSAHLCVDDQKCFRCLNDSQIACGVTDVNSWTLHIEQAGFSTWNKAQWMSSAHRKQMDHVAYHVAKWLDEYDLPNRFLTTADFNRDGAQQGWTTHNELSLSSISSSTHTDPGKGWPRQYFERRVRAYLNSFQEKHHHHGDHKGNKK